MKDKWPQGVVDFTRSSFSEGGDCVEVGKAEIIVVRDSNDIDGPVLLFTLSEWVAFADGVIAGDFDHLR